MDRFVITEFESLLIAQDPKGRRKEFLDRRSACFILTTKGRIRFFYAGGSLIAEAGRPIFLPRGLNYINECIESAESYVFNFQTLDAYQEPMSLVPVSASLARAYYEQINSKALVPSFNNTLGVLESLYGLAEQLFGTAVADTQIDSPVAHALCYMRSSYAQIGLTIGDIARECCISEVYLRKLFVKELHTTPFRKLTEIRMEKARVLVNEKRPLTEIAASVGYADIFQFSRAYKRYFGYSPSKE